MNKCIKSSKFSKLCGNLIGICNELFLTVDNYLTKIQIFNSADDWCRAVCVCALYLWSIKHAQLTKTHLTHSKPATNTHS